MIGWRELLTQTWANVWAHKLRSFLTMFGVAWGIASILFMMAIGDGFKIGYRQSMYTLGTDIAIVWGGRTRAQAGDQRAGRQIRLTYADAEAIRTQCPSVAAVTPELDRHLRITSPHNAGTFPTHGVAPVYQGIRSMELKSGRLMHEDDFRERRRVCILGDEVRKQLFGDRDPLGATVRIQEVPFTVIGELRRKDQNNTYNGFDGNKVLMPYLTMSQHFPDPREFAAEGALDNIIFMPRSADEHDTAVAEVRQLLGRRHQFQPSDDGALWIWDTVESARMVGRIYDSMQTFLAFVAVITLGLGGLGVMNIMLVAVAERTREIGIKKAIGAKPSSILTEFFLESLLLTFGSGAVGVGFAWLVCHGVNQLPLPTMFAGLPITMTTSLVAFTTLVLVGILAAIYPASRAARMTPVQALMHE